jgi:DNA-binding PadR family transcriptional regulator
MPSNGIISRVYKGDPVRRGNSGQAVDDHSKLINKLSDHQTPRNSAVTAVFSRLGYLEELILSEIEGTTPFTLSDIQVKIRERYGVKVSPKRLYDAAMRLVKRGLLTERWRGYYQLTIDYDSSVIKELNKIKKEVRRRVNDDLKENLYEPVVEVGVLRGFGCGRSCVENLALEPPPECLSDRDFAVFKIHSPGDFIDFVRNFYRDYYIKRSLLRRIDAYLHLPKYVVRRLKRECMEEASMIVKYGYVVPGCHGVYGHKVSDGYDCRGFRKFDDFIPLKDCDDRHTYEKGINIYVPIEVIKELLSRYRYRNASLFIKSYIEIHGKRAKTKKQRNKSNRY